MEPLERFFGHAGRDEPRHERRALDAVNAAEFFVDPCFNKCFMEFTVRVGPIAKAPVKISKEADATLFSGLVLQHDFLDWI